MTGSISRFAAMVLTICWLSGCDDAAMNETAPPMRTAKSLEPAGDDSSAATKDAAGATERKIGGATFLIPNAWREVPVEDVGGFKAIDADYRIDGEVGEARLTLSSSGGGAAANIDRWKGQFQAGPNDPEPRESTLTVDGQEATLVELFGTFRDSFRGGDPQPDSAMLGVVIPIPGERHYFVKLTGPRETVLDAKDAILKLAETARFRE
jgi:hypothetical protein